MLGHGGHLWTMWLLPFAAAEDEARLSLEY
jgi:hypothetical protein